MQSTKTCVACVIVVAAGSGQGATVNFDLELAARRDNNVARAESGPDIVADRVVDLGLTASHTKILSPTSGLRLSGYLYRSEYQRFTALNQLTVGAGVRYLLQPISGYVTPWVEFGLTAEQLSFQNSSIRDGRRVTGELAVGKRFTDRISSRVGIAREERTAKDTDVFSTRKDRVFAEVSYAVGFEAALYAKLSRERGDQVFSVTEDSPIYLMTKSVAEDPVFGDRYAYRMSAVSDGKELGLSLPVGVSSTLDVGWKSYRANAQGGFVYKNSELRASWLYRF